MLTETINEAAVNPKVQTTTSAATVGAANVDRWYDPYWSHLWNFLPWDQIATVIGVGWISYSIFITVKDKLK